MLEIKPYSSREGYIVGQYWIFINSTHLKEGIFWYLEKNMLHESCVIDRGSAIKGKNPPLALYKPKYWNEWKPLI